MRTSSERGFALMSALGLAILYFALMELMLIDSSRALQEARRFRARIVAATLAESGAELAAARMVELGSSQSSLTEAQGTLYGRYQRNGCCSFELTGEGASGGLARTTAQVRIQGRIEGTKVIIDYTTHSQ